MKRLQHAGSPARHAVIKAHDIRFTSEEICRLKYDKILTACPRPTAAPAEFGCQESVEEVAKEYHKDFFTADLVCQEELKKGNLV